MLFFFLDPIGGNDIGRIKYKTGWLMVFKAEAEKPKKLLSHRPQPSCLGAAGEQGTMSGGCGLGVTSGRGFVMNVGGGVGVGCL